MLQNSPQFPSEEELRIRARERQSRREVSDVDRGVRRYRSQLAKGGLAESSVGQCALRDAMDLVIPAFKGLQEKALDCFNGRGAPSTWAILILTLDADKLAYITLRTMFSNGDSAAAALFTKVANRIADEHALEAFASRERMREKNAKENGEVYHNEYKKLKQRVGRIDERAFKKWKRRADEHESDKWPLPWRLSLGMILVGTVVEQGGGWFEMYVEPKTERGRWTTTRRVRLTDLAQEFLQDKHARAELLSPWYTPMVCPPNDWVKTTKGVEV